MDIQATVIYAGKANRGLATSTVGWTIQRTTLDAGGNPTTIQFTDEGTAIWDNRATETYS